jgi:hypothetical protein
MIVALRSLATEELPRHYLGYGDSVLLENLIDITLLTFCSHSCQLEVSRTTFQM